MNKQELMGKRVVVSKRFWRSDGVWPKKEYYEKDARNVTGWIVGFRTIQNGEVMEDDGEIYWKPSSYIKCALVSMSPQKNPIKVPLDGFEVIE